MNPANFAPVAYMPELSDEQAEDCKMWIQEGRDAFYNGGDSTYCPASIAGRAWEFGWMQACRDAREALEMGI